MKSKRAFFDAAAAGWRDSLADEGARALVGKVVDVLSLGVGQRVMDLCSGTGGAVPLLAGAVGTGGTVLAVDLSVRMLEAGHRGFCAVGGAGDARRACGVFVQADGSRLPVTDGSLDGLFCMAGLAHFDHPSSAIAEMGRVLKIGGRLAVLFLSCRRHIDRIHRGIGGSVAHDAVPLLKDVEAWMMEARLVPEILVNERERLYLVVARRDCSTGAVSPAAAAAFARAHIERYPSMEAADLYKAIHQSVTGPAHAIEDEASAREALEAEWRSVEADPGSETVEALTLDRTMYRIHLAGYKARGLPLDELASAFVTTARRFSGSGLTVAAVYTALDAAVSAGLIDEGALPQGWLAFGRARCADGVPALHHSEAFRRRYRPAYRLVWPATECMPSLSLEAVLGER